MGVYTIFQEHEITAARIIDAVEEVLYTVRCWMLVQLTEVFQTGNPLVF